MTRRQKPKDPRDAGLLVFAGCLTMTYFRTGAPYYHRRAAVSRSCSGWEGVGPAGYGRQALVRHQRSGIRNQEAIRSLVPLMQKVRVGLSRTLAQAPGISGIF